MIYTVTLNPSLDYVMELNGSLQNNAVNRCVKETFYPGGKGINISIVLNNLGVASRALGFTAGFVGCELKRAMEGLGCQADFIHLESGRTRVNVKVKEADSTGNGETELNGNGPLIGDKDVELLVERVSRLSEGDYLVLAGSVPGGVSPSVYGSLIDALLPEVKVVADCTGAALEEIIKKKPFLVKPNISELADFFHTQIDSHEEAEVYAGKLQEMGAKNVIVSMGPEGAMLLDDQKAIYSLKPPELSRASVINTVGAGDSMLGGVLAGLCYGLPISELLKWGVAAGTATAISPWLTDRAVFETVLKSINA